MRQKVSNVKDLIKALYLKNQVGDKLNDLIIAYDNGQSWLEEACNYNKKRSISILHFLEIQSDYMSYI